MLSMDEFCRVAREVIEELPEQLRAWLENTVVDVELEPSPELVAEMNVSDDDPLLGLFEGAAVTELEYGEHAPNRIWLFKRPIEAVSRSREEVKYEIRRTLLHELAHHFGYSEADLEDFEARPSPFDREDER
ncbi:MAG TPA: metallopeptidase family protein [Pirellulales bacterium]|jgi:predicted Zn-dependent protease with MMP-like domain|nr:metallopeptidase family protein [Pirellulales bacterium]